MVDVQYKNLSITGYRGHTVPNLFIQQTVASDSLAVIFPGYHYTCDMPILYYSSMLLLGRSMDVLQMKTDYTSTAFQSAPLEEKKDWLSSDGLAGLRAGQAQHAYNHLVLLGKSLGTLVLTYLTTQDLPPSTRMVWFTPLLRRQELVDSALRSRYQSLYMLGNNDPNYDPSAMKRIQGTTGAVTRVFESANHSLEIPDQIHASLQIMVELLMALGDFLDH